MLAGPKGVSVPTSTSMDGVTDEHCSYNVNQTPNASDTVGSSDQKWYAKAFTDGKAPRTTSTQTTL